MLTPCPLCCRAFLNRESECKHVIICHENYNENREKPKFLSNLKSAVAVRVTNLSELLLNQISKSAVVERATEIVNRESNNQDKAKDNRESENQEPNYHVSEFCPPILAEI